MLSSHGKFGRGTNDGQAMSGDAGDQAQRDLNNYIAVKTAAISAKADGEGPQPAVPGETRLCVGYVDGELCNEPISEARLRAVPKTYLCARCKTRQEES